MTRRRKPSNNMSSPHAESDYWAVNWFRKTSQVWPICTDTSHIGFWSAEQPSCPNNKLRGDVHTRVTLSLLSRDGQHLSFCLVTVSFFYFEKIKKLENTRNVAVKLQTAIYYLMNGKKGKNVLVAKILQLFKAKNNNELLFKILPKEPGISNRFLQSFWGGRHLCNQFHQ